jgi:hypothetical protein
MQKKVVQGRIHHRIDIQLLKIVSINIHKEKDNNNIKDLDSPRHEKRNYRDQSGNSSSS